MYIHVHMYKYMYICIYTHINVHFICCISFVFFRNWQTSALTDCHLLQQVVLWRIQKYIQWFPVSRAVSKHSDYSILRCPAVLKAWRTALLQGMMPFAKDSCSTRLHAFQRNRREPRRAKNQIEGERATFSEGQTPDKKAGGRWPCGFMPCTGWQCELWHRRSSRSRRGDWGRVEVLSERRTVREAQRERLKHRLDMLFWEFRQSCGHPYSCRQLLFCLFSPHLFHVVQDYPETARLGNAWSDERRTYSGCLRVKSIGVAGPSISFFLVAWCCL